MIKNILYLAVGFVFIAALFAIFVIFLSYPAVFAAVAIAIVSFIVGRLIITGR